MTINYSKCGNCHHPASKHGGNGVCGVRGCGCRNFKPAGS
jgi:hypothetical protein